MKQAFIIIFLLSFLFVPSLCWAKKTYEEEFKSGIQAYESGDFTSAIDSWQKTLELNPDFAPAYSSLGQLYLEQQKSLEDTIWLFEQAATLDPKNPQYFTDLCRAYYQSQNFDMAEAACLKAISLDKENPGAMLSLGWIYLMGKVQPTDAIYYFKEVLKHTQSPKIYLGLGMAYARNNDRGHVVEIITLLRTRGEEVTARQLERLIRQPEPATEIPAPTIETNASQIVKGMPQEQPKTMPQGNSGNVSGFQKVQLRGKISSLPSEKQRTDNSNPQTAKDMDDTIPEPQLSVQDRINKVRQMRGNSLSGHAQGTMSLHGSATGTATVQTTGQ